jgi:hypothetical protein
VRPSIPEGARSLASKSKTKGDSPLPAIVTLRYVLTNLRLWLKGLIRKKGLEYVALSAGQKYDTKK